MKGRQTISVSILLSLLTILLFNGLAFALPTQSQAQDERPEVLVMTASGPLTPAMAEYLERGIRTAEQQGAEAIIFELNTPGGSVTLMNRMVQVMRGSRVPIVVYVSPRGAMAASAGTILTLAGHAAAMAPQTIIGAASPVDMGGQDLDETSEAKEKNALKATIRSLTQRRPPEAVALAEQTVESAEAVPEGEALEAGLVDFIAQDTADLLSQLDGFQVETSSGEHTLDTSNAVTNPLPLSFIEQLLAALTDPNIVFLLINVGVAAILIEISSPGGWVAGFIGVVCLSLATYGLGILPVNWFGIIFLVLAFILFILDIKAPTHGALTAAGVGSLIIGALVLFNSPNVPGFPQVSLPLVIASSLMTGGMFFIVLLFALRAQKVPVRVGQESLRGRVGITRSDLSPRGQVQLHGEQWMAELAPGEEPLPKGTRVEVISVDGLRLVVRKAQ